VVRPVKKKPIEAIKRGATFSTRALYKKRLDMYYAGLSKGEQALAMAILDPCHSATALSDASPFPDTLLKSVITVPMQTDLELSVPANGSLIITLINHPIIAAVYRYSNLAKWYAIPHTVTKTSANPGTWMADNKLNLCRCLGKGMTVTNCTANIQKAGLSYSSAWEVTPTCANLNSAPSSIGALNNNCTYNGIPSTPAEFLTRPGYRTNDKKGAYVQARRIDWLPHGVGDNGQISSVLGVPATGTKLDALCCTPASQADTVAPVATDVVFYESGVTGYQNDSICNVPTLCDGTDIVGVCLISGSQSQTYHVKIHALYEFTQEAMTLPMMRSTSAEPNLQLVKKIDIALDALDRFWPEDYNSAGAVWNWFKNFYNSGADKVIKPLLGSLPMGGIVSGLTDSLMKMKMPEYEEEYYE